MLSVIALQKCSKKCIMFRNLFQAGENLSECVGEFPFNIYNEP